MPYNVLISVLISILILNKSQNTYADEKEIKMTDVLTEILSNPGWQNIINVKVKHGENMSFSGKDLTKDLSVNGENSEKTAEDVENVDPLKNVVFKYQMTVQLLGCVYAKTMVKFCQSLTYILLVNSRERQKARSRAYFKSSKKNDLNDEKVDEQNIEGQFVEERHVKEQVMAHEKPEKTGLKRKRSAKEISYKENINYDESLYITKYAYSVLNRSEEMFELMFRALEYLCVGVPSHVETELSDLFKNMEGIQLFAEMFGTWLMNVKNIIPSFTDGNDDNINRRVTKLLNNDITRHLKKDLKPYLHSHCIIPEIVKSNINRLMKIFCNKRPKNPQSDIIYVFGNQIETLIEEVKNSYFSSLGFTYNKEEGLAHCHNIPI